MLSDDATVVRPSALDVIYRHDARDMSGVESNSVALVVTSPPYFAGKEYEETLGANGVPASYFDYLGLLRDVFTECARVLEPGGRIAVNVANLGRRPYRSLAGDVTGLLQDLGLLLRGEVVWWKGRAAGGSCAWGTFQRPGNPVLRDVTERIVIASKGRFDRALKPERRLRLGLPSTATISRDEFLEATTDLWEIPPESARRVGHPAPFPIELPTRLIDLFTYEGDVVLDPFMGSGTTAVAAVRAGRHYVGFETDREYADRAEERIATVCRDEDARVRLPAVIDPPGTADPLAEAARRGLQARDIARLLLETSGFHSVQADVKLPGVGVDVSFVALDHHEREWAFDLSGSVTTGHSGLRRGDTLWKALGRAAVIAAGRPGLPLVLLTTDAPIPRSAGHLALGALLGPGGAITDVIEILAPDAPDRLRRLAEGPAYT